jgi:hypothetical protein
MVIGIKAVIIIARKNGETKIRQSKRQEKAESTTTAGTAVLDGLAG